MSRAHALDLAYEHSMRAVPTQPTAPSRAIAEGRDLAARLRCLKALMDAERHGLDLWLVPPRRALQS